MSITPKSDRKFDVIVFGATGFTGSDVKWAMAGRSAKKLEAVRDEMGISKEVPLIVADSADADSLAAMASLTKVVLQPLVLISFTALILLGPASRTVLIMSISAESPLGCAT